MKAHTSDFKNNIKLLGRQLDSIITYENNGDTIELGNADLNSVTPHYEGAILKSVMRQLDIDSNVDIPKDTIINYQFGIKINDEFEYLNMGNYIVYSSEKQEDKDSYKIICYDKMLYSMIDYEAMEITYPITVRDYINAICTHLGLTFKNAAATNFANWNKQILGEKYLDSEGNSLGYKFRDVLDQLAQVTASTICINEEDDELEIRYIANTLDTIDEEYLKDINVNFKEKYGPINSIVLSRAAESDNVYLRDESSVEQNGLCEIKIVDNQIMNGNDRSTYLVDILSKLNGLEYYLNDFSSTGICYYNVCDRYGVQIGDTTYSCVMFNDEIEITQGLEEKVHTDMPKESETDYSKADKTDMRINQTYLIVDKQNQQIESVISEVDGQNSKITQITQNIDELNAKISDIADVTITGESNEAFLYMEHINASEPIGMKIRPVLENISYLYPNSGLYPSSNLFGKQRRIRFTNLTTDEVFYLNLPEDLLFYSNTVYDEFILDFENEIFRVIKRCQYNANGSVSALGTEETHDYPYEHVNLTDGDYNVEILGYSAGYIYARLMAANIYTSQFATRVEMTSAINQKANEINLVVAEKLDEEEYTHAEIVARINDDTSQIKIDADQVDIQANDVLNILAGNTINLSSKAITIASNNFNVDSSGNLSASNANISGIIDAGGGSISSWVIDNNAIYNGKGIGVEGSTGMSGSIQDWAFWAGNGTFRVTQDGYLNASNANITGHINATSGSFTGSIDATSGTFRGTIRASSGNIGGWTINSSGITGSYSGIRTTLTPRGINVDTGTSNYWKEWTRL